MWAKLWWCINTYMKYEIGSKNEALPMKQSNLKESYQKYQQTRTIYNLKTLFTFTKNFSNSKKLETPISRTWLQKKANFTPLSLKLTSKSNGLKTKSVWMMKQFSSKKSESRKLTVNSLRFRNDSSESLMFSHNEIWSLSPKMTKPKKSLISWR